MDKYSVLMSVYYKERPEYLREAIESIVEQTVPADEFVLVKDGQLTKELDCVIADYIEKYPDWMHVVSLEENMGLAKALNHGIKQCNNDIIARMDSDDISMTDRMERQLKAMEMYKADILSGTVIEFDGTLENLTARRELPQTHDEICKFAKKRSPFNHPAVMYRKTAIVESGLYEDYTYFEDYNLWATMLNNGCAGYNVKEPVLYMRAGQSMYRRRGGLKYIGCIYKFQRHLKEIGFISTTQFLYGTMVRSIVSMVPNQIRKFIYAKLLRK